MPITGNMQIVNSVLIFGLKSVALSAIKSIEIEEKFLGDLNSKNRHAAIYRGLGLYPDPTIIWVVLFLPALLGFYPIYLYTRKLFPEKKKTEYRLKLKTADEEVRLFGTWNFDFIESVQKSLEKAIKLEQEGNEYNWWVDLRNEQIKMCRRKVIRKPVQELISKAKEKAQKAEGYLDFSGERFVSARG
jgi:hypothetical protein